MGFMDSIKAGIKKASDDAKAKAEKEAAERAEREEYLAEVNRVQALHDAERADKAYQKIYKKSLDLHAKIEDAYSVLRNMDAYNTESGDKFISMCEKYISMVPELLPYWEKYEYGTLYAMPYTRLAMVYEKREDFYNAAQVCVRSINDGLPNDGPKSTMRNRLSRMIKKGKFEPTEEMQKILSEIFE